MKSMQRSSTFAAALAAAVLAAFACGDATGPSSGGGQGVADIEVSPQNATIEEIGETQRFTAVALDSDGNTIDGVTFAWSSADPTVATVNADGVATGRGCCRTLIIATASSVADSAELVVADPTPQ